MKKAIIIRGTSGIGRGLAEKLIANNWVVGITRRRLKLLHEIKTSAQDQVFIQEHDTTKISSSNKKMVAYCLGNENTP